MEDKWSIFHFSQSNPKGPGQGEGDVAALLRRVAGSLDELGDIQVQDVTFRSEMADGEDDLTMTVYYHRESATLVRVVRPRPLAGRTSVKGQFWFDTSRTLGKRLQSVGCSRGATGLWMSAGEDYDRDAPATQPVLEFKRGWAPAVGRWFAHPVGEERHASSVVRLGVHQR
jgi:hypothetical protein